MKIESKLLLQPKDFQPSFQGWFVKGALNPGAIRLPNKKIALFVRLAEVGGSLHEHMLVCPVMASHNDYSVSYNNINQSEIIRKGRFGEMFMKDGSCRLPTISHFRKVIISEDGWNVEHIEQKPVFSGTSAEGQYGVEDPRIVKIGSEYLMTYVVVSELEGVSTALARSTNLKDWKREGIIFREQNKDAVLFPEKINGRYVALHRPEGFFDFSKPSIWISYSPDLIYWGRDKAIVRPRDVSWGNERMGAGAPPIKTKRGWLIIYHGVKGDGEARTYSAGALLLDLKNPEHILARSPAHEPLFKPTFEYEKTGFIGNVVFPTGAVPTLDGKSLLIYSGGADSVTTVKKLSIADIFRHMEYYE